VVTDLRYRDGKIENRTGKPSHHARQPEQRPVSMRSRRSSIRPGTTTPRSSSRTIPTGRPTPSWASTSRYAIHRVKSLTASYQAVEDLVMRRSTQMRFDHGEIVYRLFDEAFEVLVLA
jgi:hypothetical protein